jgi:hypothetical protein
MDMAMFHVKGHGLLLSGTTPVKIAVLNVDVVVGDAAGSPHVVFSTTLEVSGM